MLSERPASLILGPRANDRRGRRTNNRWSAREVKQIGRGGVAHFNQTRESRNVMSSVTVAASPPSYRSGAARLGVNGLGLLQTMRVRARRRQVRPGRRFPAGRQRGSAALHGRSEDRARRSVERTGSPCRRRYLHPMSDLSRAAFLSSSVGRLEQHGDDVRGP
jgi:hypothetical protein